MAVATPDKTDVFQFMVVRAPDSIAPEDSQRRFIKDDAPDCAGRQDADLFSADSASEIGRMIYSKVFCVNPPPSDSTVVVPEEPILLNIIGPLLATLRSFAAPCPHPEAAGDIEALRDRTSYLWYGRYYLIPDRLRDLDSPLVPALIRVVEALRSPPLKADGTLDSRALHAALRAILRADRVHNVVFDAEQGTYASDFLACKRQLFDTLYLLYILRRHVSVDLGHVIEGLRALHVLEALATDELVASRGVSDPHTPPHDAAFTMLQESCAHLHGDDWTVTRVQPEPIRKKTLFGCWWQCLCEWLRAHGWLRRSVVVIPPRSLVLIATLEDLTAYLYATPIIHPLFARLYRFRTPFNRIKPLGIGDLKVVKQWLCGYKAGDFAHVDNVLEGETKVRVHRQLEKTEESFSFSSEKQEETQRDTQSTDRFELKREVDSVLKQDLSVNVNANVTYTYMAVVANLTAGMAYNRSQTDETKSAHNFSRDVVDKAVKRVQSRASEQRSTTKIFETEETNTHTLANPAGAGGHISGIYRWLDKEYRAQLYNYGKRLMFEFVVPEPAAFLVEARLRAFENELELPVPPVADKVLGVSLEYKPSDISQPKFDELRLKYDLAAFSYPARFRTVALKDDDAGKAYFEEHDLKLRKVMVARSFECELNGAGYDVTALRITGFAQWNNPSDKPTTADRALISITLDGTAVYDADFSSAKDESWYHRYRSPNVEDPLLNTGFSRYSLISDAPTEVVLVFQNIMDYTLAISARLALSDAGLREWQAKVFKRIIDIEQARLDAINQLAQQVYQGKLTTYRNRLAEVRATAINDLLHGQSEAFNHRIITTELKRLCLAMLTKEFDAVAANDLWSTTDAMGSRDVFTTYRRMKVTEDLAKGEVGAEFELKDKKVKYPAPKLEETANKARFIQFLEQAFDWQQLTFACYPYFWAAPPKWIDLMSRKDSTDATMSAFLQAGSCKVLLAATPAYDHAVLHYLATGEPWEGGLAPVIGDPLYVPLYDEIHRQQDDLLGAVPEGESWKFVVPTSLVYLENSSTKLPPSVCADTP